MQLEESKISESLNSQHFRGTIETKQRPTDDNSRRVFMRTLSLPKQTIADIALLYLTLQPPLICHALGRTAWLL